MNWEKVFNEHRLIFDGKLSGYVLIETSRSSWSIDNFFIVKKNGQKLADLEMSLDASRKWCERHFKLDLLLK